MSDSFAVVWLSSAWLRVQLAPRAMSWPWFKPRASRLAELMRCLRLIFVLLTALSLSDARAWGADAHRLIAELAERQLAPAVKVEVYRLLQLEPQATMASASTWADEHRRPRSAALHYVNFPAGTCEYVRARDCEGDRCVVQAIHDQIAILKSGASDAERLAALKYVIHLVADVHQPLHAGLAADKGGNLAQVRAFGRGSNLHAVWDTELIRRRAGGLSQLMRDVSASMPLPARPTDPAHWATESCEAQSADGFYPVNRLVDNAYASQWDSTLVSRLALAAHRLAQSLNRALG